MANDLEKPTLSKELRMRRSSPGRKGASAKRCFVLVASAEVCESQAIHRLQTLYKITEGWGAGAMICFRAIPPPEESI